MENKKKVIILGGAGIGTIAAWIVKRRQDAEVVGFLNDVLPVGSQIGQKKKYDVIGTSDDLERYLKEDYYFIMAFHGMQREEMVFNKVMAMNIPEDKLYSAIDPQAIVDPEFSDIAPGVIIAPGAQIGPDCIIEKYCVCLGNSFVGHDTRVKSFSHIATNAVVGAFVEVGRACHIGSNATIREKTIIGDFSLIGSGSVVLKHVEEKSIMVGNPARLLRKSDTVEK